MVGGAALAGIVGLGAVGGILANIALTPLTAGASLLQSYWYGSGLILGERMMYTVHWEKIKARLDKGETFMNVLDAEMNKDITAIAELSFKAMDDTTELFLSRASATISGHVETLLEAILNPFPAVTVTTEPAPEGEATPEGIVLTIEEIQSMSVNTLLFETQPNQITKYSEATQAHMLTEKLSRNITEDTITEEETVITNLKYDLFQTETLFLQELFTFVPQPPIIITSLHIEKVYSDFITLHTPEMQTLMIAALTNAAINGIFTIRNSSDTSNTKLKSLRDSLLALRNNLISSSTSTDIRKFQHKINTTHLTITLWQMIYSR